MADGVIRTLVVSQHEDVRRQLVAYLSRSPALSVTGTPFQDDVLSDIDADVLVVDLSGLSGSRLDAVILAAQRAGARLITLASLADPAVEQVVQQAGGIYRLKSAGADGLAETVREIGGSWSSDQRHG